MLSEITYAGNKSSDYGIVVERYPSLNRPARKYERVSVPGRNGDIIFKEDAWNNYSQEYEVWSGGRNASAPNLWTNIFQWLYPEERGTTVEDVLNLEVNGYHQLIDTYEPNTIRLAQFNEETEVENSWNNFGKSIIRFDCRPERFTADAFDWVDVGEEQTTKSGEIVTFDPAVIIEAGQGKNKADVDDTTVTDSRWFAELTDLTPSGTYTISFDYVRTGEVTIAIVTSTYNYFPLTATSGRFSGTVTATTMGAISVACDEITGSLSVSKFQCEEGSEATDYEPYELIADLDTAPYVQSLTAEITAVQNLNGYDKPWVGGSGKNKLPPVTPPTSSNGLTISVDSKGIINVNGTTTANTYFDIGSFSASNPPTDGTYILNGCVGGSGTTWRINLYKGSSVAAQSLNGDSASVSLTASDTNVRATIYINSGVTLNNVKFYPMLRLSTVSDSTYEPYENICPISGYSSVNVMDCGVNIWDEEWEQGQISSTSGANATNTTRIRSKNYIPIKADKSYYCCSDGATYVYFYDVNKAYLGYVATSIRNTAFVPSNLTNALAGGGSFADAHYVRFRRDGSGTYANTISINYPSTDTAYHSYNGTTTTISLGSTIYGGTLDVTSGVLTVNKGYVDLGSIDWTYDSGVGSFQATLSDKRTDVALRSEQFMCSAYTSVTDGRPVAQVPDGSIYNASGNPFIYVHDSRFTSASAFKTGVNGYQLVYDLATPTTVTLTPTQVATVLGQNNLWADSGTVTVVLNKPIANPSPRNARPCLKVYGSGAGTVVCNGYVINISNIPQYIYIDSDSQNCFKEISDANLNNLVTLTSGFPVLSAGGNSISWSGGVTNVEVMPRWWNL